MDLSILQSREIKLVAFDLGGVLAYSDESVLTEEEITLLHFYKKYMKRKRINSKDRELLEYAKSKMTDIYLKMYKLNEDTMPVLIC